MADTTLSQRKKRAGDRCFHTYGFDEDVYPCNESRAAHDLHADTYNHIFVEGVPRGQLKELRNRMIEAFNELIY